LSELKFVEPFWGSDFTNFGGLVSLGPPEIAICLAQEAIVKIMYIAK